MAMSRSRGASSFMRSPPMISSPSVISSNPATIRNAVDFPQPDGPTRIMNSPSWISRFMSLTASKPSGYRFQIPLKWISAIGRSPPAREPALRILIARARMTIPGPRGEHQQQAGVAGRAHGVTLPGGEHGGESGPGGLPLDVDLALDHHDVRALVNLMLLERLPRRKTDEDRP